MSNASKETQTEKPAWPNEKKPPGFLNLVLSAFVEPKVVFDYLRLRGDFWRPFLTQGIILAVFSLLAAKPMLEISNAWVRMLGQQEKQMSTLFYVQLTANSFLGLLISFVIVGFIVWLVGLILTGEARFSIAISIAAYSYFPSLLGRVLDSITIIVSPQIPSTFQEFMPSQMPAMYHTSIAQFIEGNAILNLTLVPIGIFTLWSLYLLVLGLHRSMGVKLGSAYVVGLILLLLQMGFFAFSAWAMQFAIKAAGMGG